jgi:hypothetical protein
MSRASFWQRLRSLFGHRTTGRWVAADVVRIENGVLAEH